MRPIHGVELDKRTTEEREDGRPALTHVHRSCKEKHFEYSIARVDAWTRYHN